MSAARKVAQRHVLTQPAWKTTAPIPVWQRRASHISSIGTNYCNSTFCYYNCCSKFQVLCHSSGFLSIFGGLATLQGANPISQLHPVLWLDISRYFTCTNCLVRQIVWFLAIIWQRCGDQYHFSISTRCCNTMSNYNYCLITNKRLISIIENWD